MSRPRFYCANPSGDRSRIAEAKLIQIRQTLVVSLREDLERRAHIMRHLPQLKLGPFSFVDAIDFKSQQVKDAYLGGRVKRFPTCFRCEKNTCRCENNVLIPQQVANWLSFRRVWEMCAQHPDEFFLICEDDVTFHENSSTILKAFCEKFVPSKTKVLIRMCASGQEPFQTLRGSDYELRDRVVMSNAAFVMNGRMACLLIDQFDLIETTSDIWIHRTMASREDVQAVTIEPLLATELSFNKNYARFISRIHPKGIDTEDEKRVFAHVKRANTPQEYEGLLRSWTSN